MEEVKIIFKKKNKTDSFYYCYIRFYKNGKTEHFSLKRKFHENTVNWGGSNLKEIHKREKLRLQGEYINKQNPNYESLNKELIDSLKSYQRNLKPLNHKPISFVEYLTKYILDLEKRNKYGTKNQYSNFKKYLLEFLEKNNEKDLLFTNIDIKLVKEFDLFLELKGLTNSTINNNLYKFRKLYELSINDDTYLPSKNIFLRYEYRQNSKNEKPSLSIDDVNKMLYSSPLKNEKRGYYLSLDKEGYEMIQPIEKSRLMFLFQIMTGGSRVSDCLFLTWGSFEFEENECFIKFKMFKTGDIVKIKINHTLVYILKSFVDKKDIFTTYFPPQKGCPRCNSLDLVNGGSYSNTKEKKKVLRCKNCNRTYTPPKDEPFINYFELWNKNEFKRIDINTETIYPIHLILELKKIKEEYEYFKNLMYIKEEIKNRLDTEKLKKKYEGDESILEVINNPEIVTKKFKNIEEIYLNSGLKNWWEKFIQDETKHYIEIFKRYKKEKTDTFIFGFLNEKDFPEFNKKVQKEVHYKNLFTQKQYKLYLCKSKWYNSLLKKIQKHFEFDTNLSTHTGRHTFTRIGLSQGVSLYTLSKSLKHKTLQSTQSYLKNFDGELVNKEIDEKFHSKFGI